jgi:hypothetical protein
LSRRAPLPAAPIVGAITYLWLELCDVGFTENRALSENIDSKNIASSPMKPGWMRDSM